MHLRGRSDYARCRIELSAARLTVLAAAHALDKNGNKKSRGQIAAAKVYAPNVVLRVIDAAVQVCLNAASVTPSWEQYSRCGGLMCIHLKPC